MGLFGGMGTTRSFQDDQDEQDMIRAIKRRAINGTEGPADVARINAGAQWLGTGTQAAVQGANIQQGAVSDLDKSRASMEQLKAKAESDQQIAAGQDAAANYRTVTSEGAQTTRTGMNIAGQKDVTGMTTASNERIAGGTNDTTLKAEGIRANTTLTGANIAAGAQRDVSFNQRMGGSEQETIRQAGARDVATIRAQGEQAKMEIRSKADSEIARLGLVGKEANAASDIIAREIQYMDPIGLMDPTAKQREMDRIIRSVSNVVMSVRQGGAAPATGFGTAPVQGAGGNSLGLNPPR